jgi:hypothetical protein
MDIITCYSVWSLEQRSAKKPLSVLACNGPCRVMRTLAAAVGIVCPINNVDELSFDVNGGASGGGGGGGDAKRRAARRERRRRKDVPCCCCCCCLFVAIDCCVDRVNPSNCRRVAMLLISTIKPATTTTLCRACWSMLALCSGVLTTPSHCSTLKVCESLRSLSLSLSLSLTLLLTHI